MIIIGIAWPVMVTLCAVLWPGPRQVPEFQAANSVGANPTVIPPVDSGTQLALAEDGSARIFWTIPEEGVVELTIEIDGTPRDGESTGGAGFPLEEPEPNPLVE